MKKLIAFAALHVLQLRVRKTAYSYKLFPLINSGRCSIDNSS